MNMAYKPHKRNTPVATLIKNYVNKKSGKVSESRREIQRRFNYLDWKDQKKILMAFLDSGMTDRQWAYLNIYKNWDKSFAPKVKEMWEKYHEPRCSWSIVRFFPISYIKANIDSFTNNRDHFFITMRLAEKPDYVINRATLSAADYLSVFYRTGRELSAEEADDILFEIVHDMCVGGITINDLEQDYNRGDLVITPANFRSIGLAKYYLREMGHEQSVAHFEEWNKEVKQYISLSPEYQAQNTADLDPFFRLEQRIAIVRKYAYLALDKKYRPTTDKRRLGFLNLEDRKRFSLRKSFLHPQPMPSDLEFLEEAVQDNPSVKSLMEMFDLEIVQDSIPF